MKHTLSFISLFVITAPTEMCEVDEKDVVCDKLDSLLNCCHPLLNTLIVLGDFDATTGTEIAGYEVQTVLVPRDLIPGPTKVFVV